MTISHVNFYENIKEARMRIDQTTVMYDGEPHFVLCVCDHNPDGVFRVYLDPFRPEGEDMAINMYSIPFNWHDEPGMTKGDKMDKWLDSTDGKKSGVIRKMMNSPKFNKFRPFPLGMSNTGGRAMYIERKPARYTQQGLTDSMITIHSVDLPDPNERYPRQSFQFFSHQMYNTIKGIYPSIEECVENMKDDKVANTSVAFHRDFAFVQGPIGITYLAYKSDLVGFLPSLSNREVRLGKSHQYLREVVATLGYFDTIS